MSRLERIVTWFQSKPMKEIGPAEIESFLTHLRNEDGVCPATTNRYAALLSVAFRLAQARGFAAGNPVQGLSRAREQQRPVPFLSAGDVDRLVAEARDPQLASILRVLADTGLRRSEAVALEWRDVDLRRSCLVVRRSKNRGTRDVPLTREAAQALTRLSEERGAVPIQGPDLVWPQWAGKRAGAVSGRFKTVARRAGHPDLRLHDLRHGLCSRLAQAGVPLATIAVLAGHKSLQTTQRYASHVPDGAGKAAVAAMQKRERVPKRGRKKGA